MKSPGEYIRTAALVGSLTLANPVIGKISSETPMERQMSNAIALCNAVNAHSYEVIYNCKNGKMTIKNIGENTIDIGVSFPAIGTTSSRLNLPLARQVSFGEKRDVNIFWKNYELDPTLRKIHGENNE